jgi:hypothetical protein
MIIIGILSFILEFLDISAGMGFGTITPILILSGYDPLQVIPAILLVNPIFGFIGGFMHQNFGNVNFLKGRNLKITLTLTISGVIGVLLGAFVALELPESFLKAYIGLLVFGIGIFLLLKGNLLQYEKDNTFSWKKLFGFSSIAAFNKGISGGGYGPVLTGGQIISGVKTEKAVSVTVFTEGMVSLFGVLGHIFMNGLTSLNWYLIASLFLGGIFAIPLAAYVVKIADTKRLNLAIGILSILLGLFVFIRIFL